MKEKPRSGRVELHGGDAEVERHAVDGGNAFPFGDLSHLGVAAEDEFQASRENCASSARAKLAASGSRSMASTLHRAASSSPRL